MCVCVCVCVCVCITESLCCLAETHTTLKINYTSIRFLSKGRPTPCCSFLPITVSNDAAAWAPRHRDKHEKASAHKVTGAAGASKSKIQSCMSGRCRYTEKYINRRSRRTPLSVAQHWFHVSLDCWTVGQSCPWKPNVYWQEKPVGTASSGLRYEVPDPGVLNHPSARPREGHPGLPLAVRLSFSI